MVAIDLCCFDYFDMNIVIVFEKSFKGSIVHGLVCLGWRL